MDEWNSSNEVGCQEKQIQSLNLKNQSFEPRGSFNVGSKCLETYRTDRNGIKSEISEIAIRSRSEQIVESKRGKNLKVQSFLRNLYLRIMKAFQGKRS